MKILILTKEEFYPAYDIADYLRSIGHEAGIETRKFEDIEFGDSIYEYDLAISIHYQHILRSRVLDLFTYGAINIHPSWLPYGRGADPIIWGIVEGDKLGISIHWIDQGIDTGNILYRTPLLPVGDETAEELYYRAISSYSSVFGLFWRWFHKSIESGIVPEGEPQHSKRRAKRRRDLEELGRLEGSVKNLILALSHSSHRNAYLVDKHGNKRRVLITVEDFDNDNTD